MPRHEDLSGSRFFRLTVIRPDGRLHNRPAFLCRCDCGNYVRTIAGELRSGRVQSCGCLHRERARACLSKMKTTHGESNTRLYAVWCAMRRRCTDRNCKEYRLYGGRGIAVCAEWAESFEPFRDWALANGYDKAAPRGECTIDRIDVNGNYCPENCRIATQTEQCNNRQRNHILEIHGESKTIAEWSRISGISARTIYDRLYSGWTPERAVFAPTKGGKAL